MIYDRVELQAICNIKMGQSPDSSSYNQENDGIPFFQGNADFGDIYPVTKMWCNKPTKIANKGDLLISVRAPIGALNFATEECCIGRGLAAISPKIEKVKIKYIYYALKSKNQELNNKGTGSTFKAINKGSLSEVEIPNIEISEQNNCVEKLDRVSKVIKHRKTQLNELDDLVKSRFVEMFGDPEKNSKKWNESTLSNYLNVIGGYAFKSEGFEEEGIPVLRIGNINSGVFKDTNMVYWKCDRSLEKYTIYPGDLVMSLTGTVGKDDYGNVCFLGNEYKVYYLNQRNAKLELYNVLNKYYLASILRFPEIKSRLTGICRGVRQANISSKDILSLQLPIPPINLQNQFSTFVQQVDKLKFRLEVLRKMMIHVNLGFLYHQF